MNQIIYSEKKYNILNIIHKYSHKEYRKVNSAMPELLNISPSLWRKWLYLEIEDPYQIPYSFLEKISKLLSTPIDELINYTSTENIEPLPIEKPKTVQMSIFDVIKEQ